MQLIIDFVFALFLFAIMCGGITFVTTMALSGEFHNLKRPEIASAIAFMCFFFTILFTMLITFMLTRGHIVLTGAPGGAP